jgi:hypothetical protein
MRAAIAILAGGAMIALALTGEAANAATAPAATTTSSTAASTASTTTSTTASTTASTAASTGAAATILLPTGDRVRRPGPSATDGVRLLPAAASGPGRALITRRLGDRLYVIPADAEPYLGRSLDLSLFDVTDASASPRVPVRISYTGAKPTVPGVTLTSWSNGQAGGYLTPASAATFGRALTRQWQADQRSGGTSTGALFAGVTAIAGPAGPPPSATPAYPMLNLNLKIIGANGRPVPAGTIGLVDADSSARYSSLSIPIVDGVGRASIPAGTYTALSDDFSLDAKTGRSRLSVATVNEYPVTKAGQTLTIDHRKDTVRPRIAVPKAASVVNYSFDWDRTPVVDDKRHLAENASVDGTTDVFFAPAGKPKLGSVGFLQSWHLVGRGAVPAYSYDVATLNDRIPAGATTFTPAELAGVDARYYGEGSARTAAAMRTPTFDDPFTQLTPTYLPVAAGSRRVEYVGAKGGAPQWSSGVALNPSALDDPGYLDQSDGVLAPGTQRREVWAHGPLAGSIPRRTDDYCYACRTATDLSFTFDPLTDTVPNHIGDVRDAPDGLPTTELRAYRDGTLFQDSTGARGADLTVPAAEAAYQLVYDVDRRLQDPNLSTRSQTRWTFDSAAGQGAPLPAGWYCPAGAADTCRVLPILTATVGLPVALNGTLPKGRSTFTVNAARLPGAAASTVSSATLQVRPAGEAWKSVKLTRTANGRYQGVFDNTAYAGRPVDLRVTAQDTTGSGFAQTVLRAYSVGPLASSTPAPPTTAPPAPPTGTTAPRASCPAVAPGQARCLAIWHPIPQPEPRRNAKGQAVLTPPTDGLSPADVLAAYRLPKTGGKNQTVAIVDAYDNPHAEKDLAVYRATWKLPPCTTANGCFRKVNQRGGTKPPKGEAGWGSEIALDLDAVSAACPTCKILLVEADDDEDASLGAAENTAVKLGADVVSNSFGAPEAKNTGVLNGKYYTHPGVPILAASGDDGFTDTIFPAAFGNVWAVGGTSLTHPAAAGWTETAWTGAGSGCSAWTPKPSWQKDSHCAYRTTADVSAVADPDTSLAVYDTYGEDYVGWTAIGGTSLATPLVAGMIGLAHNAAEVVSPSYAYAHRGGLHDVVGGSNGDDCGGDYLCTALKGYDAPTGLGSPRGLGSL